MSVTNLKVMTDRNVYLNFPLVRLDGSIGNGNGGGIQVSVPKDTLSSLLRENQRYTLTLENRKRFKGTIKEIVTGSATDSLRLSLTVHS